MSDIRTLVPISGTVNLKKIHITSYFHSTISHNHRSSHFITVRPNSPLKGEVANAKPNSPSSKEKIRKIKLRASQISAYAAGGESINNKDSVPEAEEEDYSSGPEKKSDDSEVNDGDSGDGGGDNW